MNQTTVHLKSNEVDMSNYRQLYGLQQWENPMHGLDRGYKLNMSKRHQPDQRAGKRRNPPFGLQRSEQISGFSLPLDNNFYNIFLWCFFFQRICFHAIMWLKSNVYFLLYTNQWWFLDTDLIWNMWRNMWRKKNKMIRIFIVSCFNLIRLRFKDLCFKYWSMN